MRLRVLLFVIPFAAIPAAVASDAKAAGEHHTRAKKYIAEVATSSNAPRIAYLGWLIHDELEKAVQLDPGLIEARLDLVRYYVRAPRVLGGNLRKARLEAAEISRRDAARGAFASGYIEYREKKYGPARRHLQQAARATRDISHRVEALTWLGWLSQETQQYDDAFAAFEQILDADASHASALYEIGRTALFAGRELDRGEAALRKYLRSKPAANQPTRAAAHEQLALLLEKKQEFAAAVREAQIALVMDEERAAARSLLDRLR